MKASFFFSSVVRESRGSQGRLAFFTLCLAVGVAAVVGVSSLIGSIRGGLQSGSRRLLAADLVVEGRRPLPTELEDFVTESPGRRRADVRELASMVSTTGGDDERRSRLAELKAVGDGYPFYGEVTLDPPGSLDAVLGDDRVAAAPDLLDTLGLDVGDEIEIGSHRFTVAARILGEPDRLDFSLVLGPRVLMTSAALDRTDLVRFGSRVKYRALFRVPDAPSRRELDDIAERMRAGLPGAAWLKVESHYDAQPTVRLALDRVESFLGLVALVSLVLGGIGVAQIVRAWIAGRTHSIAVLRCLGMRPREILVLYLGQIVVLALVGSVVGAAAGALVPAIVLDLVPELMPAGESSFWQPAALLKGIALGVGIALVFAVPPLTELWRVSPQRVLRADAEPLPARWPVRIAAGLALFAGVVLSAWAQSGDLLRALAFAAGLLLVAGVLALLARGISSLARRVPREGWNPYLRHGIASLARPGAGTTGAIVAFGLGCTVVLAIGLVEERLDRRLRTALPEGAPSTFLIDIQPEQWEGVRAAMDEAGAEGLESVPVVVSRLAAIGGRPVETLVDERDGGGRERWVLTREQRLTWRADLPPSNRLIEGELWSRPGIAEASIEEKFARDLGVGLGDVLTFDIEGIPVDVTITSLRRVEWESFSINFFVVIEPGVLDDAPSFRIAAARLEPDAERRFQDELAGGFPNVTVLRIRPILERVLGMMHQLAFGVRLLGGFTVLAGLAILIGTAVAASLRRGREVALLKTLGVTRLGVVALLATEYGLCGLVAGLTGGAAAFAIAALFVDQVLQVPPDLPFLPFPATAVLATLATAAAGLLASFRALRIRPIELLRSS